MFFIHESNFNKVNGIITFLGSMCGVVCETGYGFFEEPAPKYSCEQGGLWQPAGKAPECYGKYLFYLIE